MTHAVLAFEAGPGVGLGHRRRMEALASALEHAGATTELVPVAPALPGADVVVVDGYGLRADAVAVDAGLLAAVDDLERDLAVDVLIDPNPGGDPTRRRSARRVLHGVDYALLAPGSNPPPPPTDGPVAAILVAMGAADEAGYGAAVAGDLQARRPEVAVSLVIGPWGATAVPPGVRAISTGQGLVDVLATVDLVVTAGGVTLLEACMVARPTVAVAIADNQRRATEGLAAAGAVVGLPVGTSPSAVVDATVALVDDPIRRSELARRAGEVVDGAGARRVAEVLVAGR